MYGNRTNRVVYLQFLVDEFYGHNYQNTSYQANNSRTDAVYIGAAGSNGDQASQRAV